MTDPQKELFYVSLGKPLDVRRNVLESSKALILSLKKYESFKAVRIEKIEHVIKLKNVIKELSFLIAKLNGMFPKARVKAIAKTTEHTLEESKKGASPREISELDRLEHELGDIESRLDRL